MEAEEKNNTSGTTLPSNHGGSSVDDLNKGPAKYAKSNVGSGCVGRSGSMKTAAEIVQWATAREDHLLDKQRGAVSDREGRHGPQRGLQPLDQL